MKTSLLILAIPLFFMAQSSQASWFSDRFPDISQPKLPKMGGTLGQIFEGNKEALRYAGIGTVVLGPIGGILGIVQGHNTDLQKKKVQDLVNKLKRDETLLKAASERFSNQSLVAAGKYTTVSNIVSRKGDQESLYARLDDAYYGFSWCLVNAAQNEDLADDCQFDFEDAATQVARDAR